MNIRMRQGERIFLPLLLSMINTNSTRFALVGFAACVLITSLLQAEQTPVLNPCRACMKPKRTSEPDRPLCSTIRIGI